MNETKETTRANAVITVHKYTPAAYDEPADGPALTRIHVEESFSGDISGDGVVEFLQPARADGVGSFVGIERVAQLRKPPSWARMAEAMARSGKLSCFLTSLPAKIRWSQMVDRPSGNRTVGRHGGQGTREEFLPCTGVARRGGFNHPAPHGTVRADQGHDESTCSSWRCGSTSWRNASPSLALARASNSVVICPSPHRPPP